MFKYEVELKKIYTEKIELLTLHNGEKGEKDIIDQVSRIFPNGIHWKEQNMTCKIEGIKKVGRYEY